MLTPEIPEGFKPHDGGPCPVDDGSIVEVMMRSGQKRRAHAYNLFWGKNGFRSDIIAYREEPGDAA